ncbi:MAG: hypothetical protein ACFFER_19495, partial [Candidatus Thorarchaeota archaeon]
MNWLEWLHLPNEAWLVKDIQWCRVVRQNPVYITAKNSSECKIAFDAEIRGCYSPSVNSRRDKT